jgi:maltooligosyltrehalose trehalohydrolase
MHRFEVWAPFAKSLSVQVNGDTVPMSGPDSQGWWRANVDNGGPGTDYGYVIDDDSKPYPDPRSQWQPNGVHGLSRVYDHSAFQWTDHRFQAAPLSSAIIYELHVGTFTLEGTLDCAIGGLDHLVSLGITHVELMPVNAYSGNHGWGYDGVDLFAVHEPYGGPDALKRFVDAAHQRGLAVLLDVVYNHFGPVGNYTGRYGPYLTDSHKTPWGSAVNLEEAGSHQVRRFFCDNAIMWMRDYHMDGLRLDAVHAFVDRSAVHLLEQLSAETETLAAMIARRKVLIVESDLNDPQFVMPRFGGGLGMDAQWNDDFHHALFTVLVNENLGGYYCDFNSLEYLAKTLKETFVYDGMYSQYRNRHHGRPVGNLSQHRFIGFIQNHDQVGNRAVGDRLCEVVGVDRSKIAAALVLLGPFTPLLFMGEEWGASTPFQYFADHEDKELARLVSEGRKREFAAFGWDPAIIPDPEKRETFERSKLNWDELSKTTHAQMLAWYRDLIRLRRTTPSLNNGEPGNTSASFNEEQRWLCMRRGSIIVTCNFSEEEQSTPGYPHMNLLLASRDGVTLQEKSVKLPPESVAIISLPNPG